MASSTIYHARSFSLPLRPHPVSQQLDQQLSRLRSSHSASSSSQVTQGLNDIYSCFDELSQLPKNAKWVDEVLDGSVRLLDMCSASRDALQQSKDRLQDVQSALRRRSCGELRIVNEANKYLHTRRSVKKSIKNILKNLKTESDQKDGEKSDINTIKDVQAVTAETFKSLLSFIAGSQKNGWFVVSKLINKNTNKESSIISEFEKFDVILNSLICQKKTGMSSSQMENLTNRALLLEAEIEELDESLECLFRHLVKTRATLLNIYSC